MTPNIPADLSPEAAAWLQAQMAISNARTAAVLREEINKVDDWANGIFAALRDALGHLLGEALASQWVKHLGEFKTARTARDAMQQGNHLLLLKEASPHGTWRDRANALGLDAGLASRLLSVARRFASAPDPFFTAVGTVSKLFVLLPLEPDQVDAICHGEEVCGLTLESIRSMTVVQLRAALRKGKRSESSRRVQEQQALLAEDLALVRPKPVHLSVEEERMLRLFRQCSAPAREALFSVAGLLAEP